MIRGVIHFKCGTETSESHKGSREGGELSISYSMTPGGYNGHHPATGHIQKVFQRVTENSLPFNVLQGT